jgi:uncharacterized protein (TIGR04222 family)
MKTSASQRLAASIVVSPFVLSSGGNRFFDSTGERPPPVPTRPDPYEIAYLRGGVGAVIQLAAYALKCRQMIEMQAGGRVARVSGLADPTNPIETRVLEEVGLGETAS